MFIELHVLQNFAPSNLNRDDTGAPKECEFGGYRRARVSSQSWKRAIRQESKFATHLDKFGGGVRTRRLIVEIAESISGSKPASPDVVKVVAQVFAESGIERPKEKGETEKDNTKQLLFMDRRAIDDMVGLFQAHWEVLTRGSKEAKGKVYKALGEILAAAVSSPDIALFGRMIEVKATTPFGKFQLGVDAACQVAHAISTNKVNKEFDFFTAVDELLPKGETGAGMMGTIEFNSACFYRYANVDGDQLLRNLTGNEALARVTLRAFLQSAIDAIPTGKQTSMPSPTPPSFVFVVVRDAGLWSLANAFVRPIRATEAADLIEGSITALNAHWGELVGMYGEKGIQGKWVSTKPSASVTSLGAERTTIPMLIEHVVNAVRFGPASADGAA